MGPQDPLLQGTPEDYRSSKWEDSPCLGGPVPAVLSFPDGTRVLGSG